jgi:hypothetical protein
MAIQLSVAVRNAMLDSVEVTIGASPKLHIRTGAAPADCSQADAGTLLAEMDLPADWMAAAAAGSKAIANGPWQDLLGNADGVAAHYRIKDSAGTTCHLQGTVTVTGGGGDMQLVNTNIATGQPVSITAFTLNAGNA